MVGDNPNAFQFPNGSIKSIIAFDRDKCGVLFQFPNGSIKSSLIGTSSDPNSCFNSLMVRLKGGGGGGGGGAVSLFQFPNGSIKRQRLPIANGAHIYCFNSLMVRLKAKDHLYFRHSFSVSIP